jgi:hypothetical protein
VNKPVIAALCVAAVVAVAFAVVLVAGPKALNVRDVGSDPLSHAGTITITGVMGGVSQQDPSVFGIMDLKELQCKARNCEKLLIPVKYQGKQPVPGDEVKVTGSFVKLGDGLLFAAQKVKVVRNHKIGG